jgi:molybdopterin molybdotransferase
MISVEQAIEIVRKNSCSTPYSELKKVSASSGYILYEDVISPIDMPPFRQSAMDGYALCLNGNTVYKVIGEVKAGDPYHPVLNPGESVRIFTGAPVPDSADAVIMQERTQVADDKLTIDAPVQAGDNIRPRGEQVLKEDIALKKGTKLTPAAIAFLTALGITEVSVYAKPSIAIVVTGDELAQAGEDLDYGQIYESNAVMLRIVLDQLGYKNVSAHKVADVYDDTLSTLKSVISNHDVVLISGGISVGDYDFVGKALAELGVEQCFYKIKQKPGKPLFFGKKGDKLIFALPGNPASALSCFYIYVLTALELRSGNGNFTLPMIKAQSVSDFTKKGDRSQFLKAIYIDGSVEILEGQSSSMLHTFSLANAMVYVRETADSIKINDTVEVILLPIY